MVKATILAEVKARGWFWLGDVALGLLQVSICGCFIVVSFVWVFAGDFGVGFSLFFSFLVFLFNAPGALRSALHF
jgi:hypothetical protein